ncbi:unnamed protein product [Adineta ricciae]|uniref:Uncharacterized protein n=1 Tax=Adineta ricciae TaxID=249248 RepID=A0A814RP13_ADIRI|nr:unnamed protein product [Adineta ricciae]
MYLVLLVTIQLFYAVTCQLSCYNCPMQANVFDSIITVDTVPNDLKDCSLQQDQTQCSIHIEWTQNPNRTLIMLRSDGERQDSSGRHNLENAITLTNNGTRTQWRKTMDYICSTDQCNSPAMVKRLLRSLTSEDNFQTFSPLLNMNTQFHGNLCIFFANSSASCDTEMDRNTCRQCATQEYIQSKPVEVCLNCVMDDIIENFVTRQVKFFMKDRQRHDIWMIECQQENCNAIETGDLIRQNSQIDFDFTYFLNGSNQFNNFVFEISLAFVLTIFNLFEKLFQ